MSNVSQSLLRKYPIISDQVDSRELQVILDQLELVLDSGVNGDVVELGCYVGTTSLFLRRMLDYYKSSAALHVYDSFEGLPEKHAQDQSVAGDQFVAGELSASKSQFIMNFKKAHLALPVIHKGWFSNVTPADMPREIAFAFLDGDYYQSILDSLKLVWPHLSKGAVVIVDDYQNEALPGAAKAVSEWIKLHPAQLTVSASLAILKPQQ